MGLHIPVGQGQVCLISSAPKKPVLDEMEYGGRILFAVSLVLPTQPFLPTFHPPSLSSRTIIVLGVFLVLVSTQCMPLTGP